MISQGLVVLHAVFMENNTLEYDVLDSAVANASSSIFMTCTVGPSLQAATCNDPPMAHLGIVA